MQKLLVMSIMLYICTGCNVLSPNNIDMVLFHKYGFTLFNKIPKTTLKEIHLDNGELLGNNVIVKGNITNIGNFYTHITIADQDARLLVILTDIIDIEEYFNKHNPKALMIWGTVERGVKGYPYINAKVIKKINAL